MVQKNHFLHDQKDDSTSTTLENAADSALSGDEAYEVNTPSPKKRRGAQKRVVSVPFGDGDGSKSKSEVYPPPDSWSWRKYGQKPIKGSPYPRGYYRCSSSKGCPARKQVERNRLDPTVLLITYSCEHNHSLPNTTTKNHHHHHLQTPAAVNIAATMSTSNSTSSANADPLDHTETVPEEFPIPDLESDSSGFSELAGELGWFSDVGSTLMDSTSLVSPTWAVADMAVMLPIGEEDQSLFGDLGELPECSVVFRSEELRKLLRVTPAQHKVYIN